MTTGGSRFWNVRTAVAACPVAPWHGEAWRCHTRKWPGDNANGSRKVTGRFNRGRDRFPEEMIWPAPYTGLAEHIALGEALRHTEHLPDLAWKRISHLEIRLQAVLDGTSLVGCGLPGAPTLADLCHPTVYVLTHANAEAVRTRGAEALLIPTCTRFYGNNLIVFPDLLRPGSIITVLGTEDPDLYIDWDALRSTAKRPLGSLQWVARASAPSRSMAPEPRRRGEPYANASTQHLRSDGGLPKRRRPQKPCHADLALTLPLRQSPGPLPLGIVTLGAAVNGGRQEPWSPSQH